MQELFSAFGIDWRLLVVNIINFTLLLTALWYFLYHPVTAMLEERRGRVAEGVAKAAEADALLESIEASRAERLAAAGREVDEVLGAARTAAAHKQLEIIAAGEASAAALLAEAQAQAEELKRQALAESKQEIAKLVVLGIEKTQSRV